MNNLSIDELNLIFKDIKLYAMIALGISLFIRFLFERIGRHYDFYGKMPKTQYPDRKSMNK